MRYKEKELEFGLLEILTTDKDSHIRQAAAFHNDATEDVLLMASTDSNYMVRMQAIYNPNATPMVFECAMFKSTENKAKENRVIQETAHNRLSSYFRSLLRNKEEEITKFNMRKLFKNENNRLNVYSRDGNFYLFRGDRSVVIDGKIEGKLEKSDRKVAVGKDFNFTLENGTNITITNIWGLKSWEVFSVHKNYEGNKYTKVDSFSSIVPKNGLVLDEGCGYGVEARRMHANGLKVIGISVDDLELKAAKRISPRCEFMKMDMHNLRFPDSHFDGIWCSSTMASKDINIRRVLAEDFRILKKDGVIFISEIPIGGHKKNYEEKEIYQMFNDTGFEIIKASKNKEFKQLEIIAKAKKHG